MQLVAYGAQDIYLTGNPQITFFKVVYRRHTNFSMECIQQTISGASSIASNSEGRGVVTVDRKGDLLYRVYVNFINPKSSTVNDTIHYADRLIKNIDLEIGGQLIDRQPLGWMQIWNRLTIDASKKMGYEIMTGLGKDNFGSNQGLITDNITNMLQIPLNFWFCRSPGLALPLIALQYHEVKFVFTWGKASDTVDSHDYSNSSDLDSYPTPTCEVWGDYIYLDTDERRRFAQVSHEYLIEQIQVIGGGNKSSFDLDFNHPVKELIWTNTLNASQKGTILMNGHERFQPQYKEYFQLRQPYDHHTSVPDMPHYHDSALDALHGEVFHGISPPLPADPSDVGTLIEGGAWGNTTDPRHDAISLTTIGRKAIGQNGYHGWALHPDAFDMGYSLSKTNNTGYEVFPFEDVDSIEKNISGQLVHGGTNTHVTGYLTLIIKSGKLNKITNDPTFEGAGGGYTKTKEIFTFTLTTNHTVGRYFQFSGKVEIYKGQAGGLDLSSHFIIRVKELTSFYNGLETSDITHTYTDETLKISMGQPKDKLLLKYSDAVTPTANKIRYVDDSSGKSPNLKATKFIEITGLKGEHINVHKHDKIKITKYGSDLTVSTTGESFITIVDNVGPNLATAGATAQRVLSLHNKPTFDFITSGIVSIIIIGNHGWSLDASSMHENINVYSFALKPEEHQPSGTCNFSRIDNAQLQYDSSINIVNIYALNYNVLRIMSGMGGLAYSN